MNDDPRDVRTRRPVPPHVRAQTAKPVGARAPFRVPADHDLATHHGVPGPVVDEVTGNHETIEQLQEWRESRPPLERVTHLEERADSTHELVVRFDEKLDTIIDQMAESARERQRRHDQEMADRAARRKLIVPIITAIGVAVAGVIAAYISHGGR